MQHNPDVCLRYYLVPGPSCRDRDCQPFSQENHSLHIPNLLTFSNRHIRSIRNRQLNTLEVEEFNEKAQGKRKRLIWYEDWANDLVAMKFEWFVRRLSLTPSQECTSRTDCERTSRSCSCDTGPNKSRWALEVAHIHITARNTQHPPYPRRVSAKEGS